MPIYDNNGSASNQIGLLYDNNGTTSSQIGKVYDNNGTTDSLIYEIVDPLILFDGTSVSNWTIEHGVHTNGQVYAGDSGGVAANYWWQCHTTWDAGKYDTLTITHGGNSLLLWWWYADGSNSGYIGLPTSGNWSLITTVKEVPANATKLWLRISIPVGSIVNMTSVVLSKS